MRYLLLLIITCLSCAPKKAPEDNYHIYTSKAVEEEQVRQEVDYCNDSLLHVSEPLDTL